MSEDCLAAGWNLTRGLPVMRISGCRTSDEQDIVADEVPTALVYNGISHAVMLASPADLQDFAVGFSLTEGIIDDIGEIYACEAVDSCQGIELHIHLAGERFAELKGRRRALAGRTGCGLCGVDSLSAVARKARSVTAPPMSRAAICRAVEALQAHQALFALTGGVHAAAWADLAGTVVAVREDVGRHNALDKLIGWRARTGHADPGFIVVSSRASFEMVQKASQAGVGALIAISAPTAMAVRLAASAGLLLAGFARQENLSVYTCAERLTRD